MSDNDAADAASASVPEVPATAPEASKGWSDQDRRMLIITIAGGLAANLATVIIVGAAIGFVHQYRVESSVKQLFLVLVFIFVGSLGIVVGSVLRNAARTGRHLGGPRALELWLPWFGWFFVGMGSLLMLEAVLILTGLAAGLK